jgi:hypothetical protein
MDASPEFPIHFLNIYSMRWDEPLPKRSSTSASVARWISGGKSPLAVNGGRDTSAPRRYRVSCVILPQLDLLLSIGALDAEPRASAAAGSGSAADAGGSQVQAVDND